jgi:hypothetical protein
MLFYVMRFLPTSASPYWSLHKVQV